MQRGDETEPALRFCNGRMRIVRFTSQKCVPAPDERVDELIHAVSDGCVEFLVSIWWTVAADTIDAFFPKKLRFH